MRRNKSTKIKTAKGRKISSTRWLQRQFNDQYAINAKKDGYLSRAAYKLLEIDAKFHILGKEKIIIDLGAAPGSWTQIALKTKPKKLIAVDLLPMHPFKDVESIIGDFTDENITKKIFSILDNNQADLIMSDMMPNISGDKNSDHLRIIDLCEQVLEFARKTLKQDGILIIKIFQGGQEKSLFDKLKKLFAQVKFFKPQASHKESAEVFLIATKFINC